MTHRISGATHRYLWITPISGTAVSPHAAAAVLSPAVRRSRAHRRTMMGRGNPSSVRDWATHQRTAVSIDVPSLPTKRRDTERATRLSPNAGCKWVTSRAEGRASGRMAINDGPLPPLR